MKSNTEEIEDQIKMTSIRGRLAFGVSCIQRFTDENEIKNTWIDRLIDTLWEFTTSERLDEWDEKISDLRPVHILDTSPGNKYSDYPSLSESDFNNLRQLYRQLPEAFIEMIDETIEIGIGNLYGGTGDYSEFTLKPTLRVFEKANSYLNEAPDFKQFMRSKFSEFHGWGDPIEKEKFKENVW